MNARQLGIFARVFPVGPAADVARSIAGAGYTVAQLNLRSIGLPTIPAPDGWTGIDPERVRADFAAAGVSCWGVSCSYNMAHPDASVRKAETAAAIELIRHARGFGASAVTLCTGSRNPENMWAFHPDNASKAAWRDMRAELDALIAAAIDVGVVLGVEPERGNVVSDATAALRLYSELGSDADAVGIIADSANLLAGLPTDVHHEVLERSFKALAQRIICLHAKDLVPWSATLLGNGVIDYRHVGSLYRRLGLAVPVIVQDVAPEQAADARAYIEHSFRTVDRSQV